MRMDPDGEDDQREPTAGEVTAVGEVGVVDGTAVKETAVPGPERGARAAGPRVTERDFDPEDWAAASANGDEWLRRERPPHW